MKLGSQIEVRLEKDTISEDIMDDASKNECHLMAAQKLITENTLNILKKKVAQAIEESNAQRKEKGIMDPAKVTKSTRVEIKERVQT